MTDPLTAEQRELVDICRSPYPASDTIANLIVIIDSILSRLTPPDDAEVARIRSRHKEIMEWLNQRHEPAYEVEREVDTLLRALDAAKREREDAVASAKQAVFAEAYGANTALENRIKDLEAEIRRLQEIERQYDRLLGTL